MARRFLVAAGGDERVDPRSKRCSKATKIGNKGTRPGTRPHTAKASPGAVFAFLLLLGFGIWNPAEAATVPASEFARDGYLTRPALSPSGRHLAGFVHHEGVNIIVVWDLETGVKKPIAKLSSTKQYLHWVEWVSEDRLIVSSSIPNSYRFVDGSVGRTSWLIGIDRDGNNMRNLATRWFRGRGMKRGTGDRDALPLVRSGDDVISMMPEDSERVLLQIYKMTAAGSSAYSMNTSSGRLKLEQGAKPNIIRWYADHEGRVRMGFGMERKGGGQWIIARIDEDDDWETIAEWNILKGECGPSPLGFGFEKSKVYLAQTSPKGTAGVYPFDLRTKKFGKLIFADEKYDVASLVFDKKRKVLEGVRWVGDTNSIHFLDPAAKKEHEAIQRALGGKTTWLVDESADGNRKLYLVESAQTAPRYVLYDRTQRNIDELYDLFPAVSKAGLAGVRPISYQARDGYEISGYLTLPRGQKASNLPTVIYPHGGPWSRDIQSFDRMAQFLSSRGFAVLQTNFRGSSGMGGAHQKAGHRQLGEKIQDDITDGVKWMIAQGIADPDRIAIYGGSHGGYATLMGLARTPELYRCGAALAPVTDLYDFVSSQRWNLYNAGDKLAWGDLREEGEKERLMRNSPVRLAEQFEAPVLLAHGRHDKVVPYKHSKEMKVALDDAGKKSELVIYEDSHGFVHQPNRIDFYQRLEKFLKECTDQRPPAASSRAGRAAGVSRGRFGS